MSRTSGQHWWQQICRNPGHVRPGGELPSRRSIAEPPSAARSGQRRRLGSQPGGRRGLTGLQFGDRRMGSPVGVRASALHRRGPPWSRSTRTLRLLLIVDFRLGSTGPHDQFRHRDRQTKGRPLTRPPPPAVSVPSERCRLVTRRRAVPPTPTSHRTRRRWPPPR